MSQQAGLGAASPTDRGSWMPRRPDVGGGWSHQITLPGYRDFVLVASSDASEVYRAHQDGVERPVAVKVLLLADAEAIARFERELDITVQLGRQHPHIVKVIDTGTTGAGRPCIVMEYYDRGSLHDRLVSRGPLPWSEVLAAGTVVADALAFAHAHGVIHRDVKPQNVLVLPTSYVVADFGIARPIDAGYTSSVDWFSFRHASPQVIEGLAPTVADDIWSVGSTLFTLLDGRAPFAADDGEDDASLAYMARVRTGRRRSILRPDVPPGLVAVIERCLHPEAHRRFPDATALHDAFRTLAAETRSWAPLAESAPTAPPPPMPSPDRAGLYADGPPIVPAPPPSPRAQPAPPPPPREATGPTTLGGVSPAAMANLARSMVVEADPATGPSTGRRASAPSPPEPGRLRRRLVIGTVALLGGAVLGTGVLLAKGLVDGPAADGQVRASPSIPAAAGSLPSGQNIQSTRIAPAIVELYETEAGVYLRWSDPSQGEAVFVVNQVVNGTGVPLHDQQLDPGTTEITVARERIDSTVSPFCVVVLAAVAQERGVSQSSCLS